ncbi:MAG: nucleotidyltransferase family protein [Halioglobus sp.]
MTVGVLLLAAGRSRRFGSDKRRALLKDGRSLLDATLTAVSSSGLPLLVCLSPTDDELATALADSGVTTVTCHEADHGMGHTLANGVAQVPSEWQGLLVAMGDMPWVQPTSYRDIAGHVSPDTIVVPQYAGQRGNPVGFGAAFFDLLAGITGDRGARDIVRMHPDAVRALPVDDPGVLLDVDIPDALAWEGR